MSGGKHIVITVNAAWNLLNYRTGIIAMLLEQGHRITVLTPRDETVDELCALGCAFEPIAMTRRGQSPLSEVGVVARFYRQLRRLRPDVVLSFTIKNNIYAGIVCRALQIPFIPNVSGRGAVFSEGRTTITVVLAAYRLAFGKAATVFYQNPEDRDIFLQHGVGRTERAALLPGSGVDLDKFIPVPLPGSPDAPVFLMIARVLREKGVDEYAQAARAVRARYPDARFDLIGQHDSGSEYVPSDQLARWQTEGILNYRGTVPDVRPIVAEADAVVLPSYYLEGTPRSLIESAAMGRPIVTTNTAGCRDTVIPGISGYLCHPRDAADLTDKLMDIAGMTPHARATMGLASRQHIETTFDEKHVIDAYRRALQEGLQ